MSVLTFQILLFEPALVLIIPEHNTRTIPKRIDHPQIRVIILLVHHRVLAHQEHIAIQIEIVPLVENVILGLELIMRKQPQLLVRVRIVSIHMLRHDIVITVQPTQPQRVVLQTVHVLVETLYIRDHRVQNAVALQQPVGLVVDLPQVTVILERVEQPDRIAARIERLHVRTVHVAVHGEHAQLLQTGERVRLHVLDRILIQVEHDQIGQTAKRLLCDSIDVVIRQSQVL